MAKQTDLTPSTKALAKEVYEMTVVLIKLTPGLRKKKPLTYEKFLSDMQNPMMWPPYMRKKSFKDFLRQSRKELKPMIEAASFNAALNVSISTLKRQRNKS